MAESKEELKNFLIKVKEESEKNGLKASIQKTKIMMPCGRLPSPTSDFARKQRGPRRRRRRPPASLCHSHLLWKLLRTKNADPSCFPSPSSRPARAARTPRRFARSGTDNRRSPVSPLPGLPAPDPAPFRLAGTGHRAPARPGTSPAPARSPFLPPPPPPRGKLSLTGRDSTEAAPGVAGGGKKETLSLLCFPRVCFLAKKMIPLCLYAKEATRAPSAGPRAGANVPFLRAASVPF